MEQEKSDFDRLVDLHDDVKDFKIKKSLEILKIFHSREGKVGNPFLHPEDNFFNFKKNDKDAIEFIQDIPEKIKKIREEIKKSKDAPNNISTHLNESWIKLKQSGPIKQEEGIILYKYASQLDRILKRETKLLIREFESYKTSKEQLKHCLENLKVDTIKTFLSANRDFIDKYDYIPHLNYDKCGKSANDLYELSSCLRSSLEQSESNNINFDDIKNKIEEYTKTLNGETDHEEYYIPHINRMILEDMFPGEIARRLKFRLTEDEEVGKHRLNLSSTNTCTYALSEYIEIWKDNKRKYEEIFGSLNEYYIYIVDGLDSFLKDDRNSQSLESTDEFSLLNILLYLKRILDKIQQTDDGWSYNNDVITNILNLIWDKFNYNELKFQDNTHPFIHYAFLCAIFDWQKEILKQGKKLDDFENVAKKIYEFGKYEMYRQISLKKANDGSLFDVKRLIYSLLIVTRDDKYSNDKIRREVLELIFAEQLETGLWPVGNVVNNDFVLERGIIRDRRSRIINISPILSSIECLNNMLLHKDIASDLKEEVYQIKLKKTYDWIKKRLREKDTDFLLYSRDIRDASKIIDALNVNELDKDSVLSRIRLSELEIKELIKSQSISRDELPKKLAEILNRKLLQGELLFDKKFLNEGPLSDVISERTKRLLEKNPEPKGNALLQPNRMLLDDYFSQEIAGTTCVDKGFDRPLGWYPEYEGTHTPKSWVAGHTLIFLKKYCELLSELIEEKAAERLQAKKYKYLEPSWDKLSDSYGMKKFLGYMDQTGQEKETGDYRSAFVFGPPGTGKSTIAKALAKKLKWNYVEITPGQFLEDGEMKIIKTANSLFKRLKRMKKTVIFFDEVDQFVELRKESTGASAKWIVTALLPQIQELRNQKDIIFILATNHITKVDPAIKRRGRVDFVLPMGPICWKDRMKLLSKEIDEIYNKSDDNIKEELGCAFWELSKINIFNWEDISAECNKRFKDFIIYNLGLDSRDIKITISDISDTTKSIKINEKDIVSITIDETKKEAKIKLIDCKVINLEVETKDKLRKLYSKPTSNFDNLKRTDILSRHIINFLSRTDCMSYNDIKDILKSIERNYKPKKEGDDLFKMFFETSDLNSYDRYDSYINTDLKKYQYVDLEMEKEFIQMPPTIKTITEKLFGGMDEILYGNSFGSPLLCAEDFKHTKEFIDRLSEKKNIPDEIKNKYPIFTKEDFMGDDKERTALKDGLNEIISCELNQIVTYENLLSLKSSFKDIFFFKNTNVSNSYVDKKINIKLFINAFDVFVNKIDKKIAPDERKKKIKKEDKLQLAYLVWGLNRLALEKLYPEFIAPSYVFGAYPYQNKNEEDA